MGTVSEGSDGGGIAGDFGVGTIVWVRRRNGSWWPGRILGIEELAESHVISSRSGTPVKLLGREDASVDWYNLEKSKRVKPFRCGEFDACLERAEASHSTPIKKREKYARREDAILHALELEKQLLEMQQENTATSYHAHAGNKTLGISERELNQHSSEVHVSSILANQESQTSPGKISSLLNECHLDHSLPIHRNRNVKTSISEDDKQEIATHISLEDVSPEVKSEGKLFLSIGGNSDITDEDHSDLLPHGEHSSGFISQAVTDKNLFVFKRKTSLLGAINDSPAKRRDRRRPLVKVLQNSSKLPGSFSFLPHQCRSSNPMPAEEHLISIAHDAQKNTSIHPSPNADDPLDYSSHSWKHTPADSGNAYLLQQPGSMSNESTPSVWTEENDFDSSATDSELEMVEEKFRSGITQPLKQTAESSIETMSHWHLKGKRNNRILSKRLLEYADGKNIGGTDKSDVQFRETSPEGKATTSYNIGKFDCATAPSAPGREFSSEKEMDYDTGEEEMFIGLGNKRDDLERQDSDYINSDDDRQLISEPGWGAMRPFQIWKTYWEDPEDNLDQFYTPFSYRMIPMLIDVELKVQARYQGGHVPLVSLMSKLNGMAIIGHPVHIEVLEDGSSGLLLSSNGFGDATAPPIWRTAKRTSMHRHPRSNPDPSDLLAPQMKRTRFYHAHRSASGRFQRKPLKTLSLSSSQKTRALSSFVSEKKINSMSVFLGGLIKADGTMPLVTCIPTKVVFTRILESIGRPSAAVPHRALQKEGNLS